jgi:hypothetical protein
MSVPGGLLEEPVNVKPVIRDSHEEEGSKVKPGDDVMVTDP